MSFMWIGDGGADPAWSFGISHEKESGEIPPQYQVLLYQVRIRVVGEREMSTDPHAGPRLTCDVPPVKDAVTVT